MRKRLQKEGKLSKEEEARLQREWNMGRKQKEEEARRREEFAKGAWGRSPSLAPARSASLCV